MFAEVLLITFICFLSGHHASASTLNDPGFSDDDDINLPSWLDHRIQVEAGLKRKPCMGHLCCPDDWFCCNGDKSCCKIFHRHIPVSSKYCK